MNFPSHALEIRRRVLLAFERAEREPDPLRRVYIGEEHLPARSIIWAAAMQQGKLKRSARLITGPVPERVRPERVGEGPLKGRPAGAAGSPRDAAAG